MLTSGCWRRVLCTVQCEATASSAPVRCGGTPPGTVIRSRTADLHGELGSDSETGAIQAVPDQVPAGV